MKIVSEPLIFDWDTGNINKNFLKHRVTYQEAEEAFSNKYKYIFKDERHSINEQRYGMFGITNKGRLMSLVFIIRGGKVRIITARDMSRKERRTYEQYQKNT